MWRVNIVSLINILRNEWRVVVRQRLMTVCGKARRYPGSASLGLSFGDSGTDAKCHDPAAAVTVASARSRDKVGGVSMRMDRGMLDDAQSCEPDWHKRRI